MKIINGRVFTPGGYFEKRDLLTANDRILRLEAPGSSKEDTGQVIDAGGLFVIPGLVDIHIHACGGCDFSDGVTPALETMSHYLGSRGVTSFLGTSMTLPEDELARIYRTAAEFMKSGGLKDGASLRGIQMEGPFFSYDKRGAHNPKYLQTPDIDKMKRLIEASDYNLRIVDIAPELDGAMELIRYVADQNITVSLAHSAADYPTAIRGFAAGASHVTHLFNAMAPFTHRAPGLIGAGADLAKSVELICDGIHIDPAVIRSVFRWFGDDRVCIISDALRCCGMPDGKYGLGGQDVFLKDGIARLADGTIAGAATDLMGGMTRAVNFGVPLESAVKAATINPARAAGIDHLAGSFEKGHQADIVLMDSNLEVRSVFANGRQIV